MRTWFSFCFVLLLTACTTPKTLTSDSQKLSTKQWQGRIRVTVQSDPPSLMSASFSLEGDAQDGALHLFSPFGTTLSTLQWRPGSSQWLQDGQQRHFDSLAHLTEKITGAVLPIEAMFDWLEGRVTPSAGWQTDLSALSSGTLVAKRIAPEPLVVLRIKLDTP